MTITSERFELAFSERGHERLRRIGSLTLRMCGLIGVFLPFGAVLAAEPPLKTITFQVSSEDIANPERGFLHFRSLLNTAGYDSVRSQGHTLIYGQILADNFRNSPFSQSFLDQIQAGFDAARANGIKVKPRVAYNDDGGADAPKSVILNHIQQLKPLWVANKDVIYHMDAGFIGAWGEWHSSQNGLDNNADRTEILTAILDALPKDRMVGIRTPHFKRQIFNGSPADDTLQITAANAFDESNLARVGHLNDCFLASSTDAGTYVTPGWSRADELAYIGGESMYSPHGGETCSESPYSTGANAISEMTQLHTDYLNIDYHPNVIQSWVNDGSFDEISKRLGYRFELQSASLPDAIKPSSLLEIEFDIDNVGFGELFNPRNIEVTLKNNTTGEITSAPLHLDPRLWSGGSSNHVHTYLSIPADMVEGTYSVGLMMPDFEQSIADDVRYSIRFANVGIWDSQTGINVLKTNLSISQNAEGIIYANLDEFEEILDPGQLQLAGDYNNNGVIDGADYTVWRDTLEAGSTGLPNDLTPETVDESDFIYWRDHFGETKGIGAGAAASAVPEPSTLVILYMGALAMFVSGELPSHHSVRFVERAANRPMTKRHPACPVDGD